MTDLGEALGRDGCASVTMGFGLPSRSLVERLATEAKSLAPWLSETRRAFHRQPELGWREIETTRRIAKELANCGYGVVAGRDLLRDSIRLGISKSARPGDGDTGCLAVFDGGRPGPTVCLRVDIDALPIEEAVSDHRAAAEGWASTEKGVMHACGHDGHIAIGLGVARVLRPFLKAATGKFLLLFQPAEEGGRGARAIVDAGWMADVDLLIAVHIGLGVPSGTIAIGVDGFLATRKFWVELSGRPAHAGKAPETGRNALIAACQTVLGLHSLAQSGQAGVRVNVGILTAGISLNIVPDRAIFEFEIRAAETSVLNELDERCRRLIAATATAHDVGSRIEIRGEASNWRNPEDVVAWATEVNRLSGAFAKSIDGHLFGASEDATLLANAVKARGGTAGIFVLGADLADGHHTPHFDFDERVLQAGTFFLTALIGSALACGNGRKAHP
jgi:aminobenzoyl-glutamate utilization protein A